MHFHQWKRRQVLTLLGGATAAWPLAARAQQRERMRRVGWLTSQAANDPVAQAYVAALLQGLQEAGWSVGRNVRIDYRWGAANAELKRRYAAELIALVPDVIVTTGDSNTGPLLQATRAVPIVFVLVPDPVGAGFVASLARPGGNATGFLNFEFGMSGKWPELLNQIAPTVTRVAVLRDPSAGGSMGQLGAIQGVVSSLRMEASPIDLRDVGEIERAIVDFRPLSEWWTRCSAKRLVLRSSRIDHRACVAPSVARRLSVPILRRRWRPDLLRPRRH